MLSKDNMPNTAGDVTSYEMPTCLKTRLFGTQDAVSLTGVAG
jgi:hypothetical protein